MGVLTPVDTLVVGLMKLEMVLLLMVALLVPCTSIPRTENPVPVLLLVIPLMVLPVIVLEVAPSGLMLMPLKEPSLADARVERLLLVIAIADPADTEMPLTIAPDKTEVPVNPLIKLLLIVILVPPPLVMAVTVPPALDKVPMVLFEVLIVGEKEILSIPVTKPVVDDSPEIVFELILLVKVVFG